MDEDNISSFRNPCVLDIKNHVCSEVSSAETLRCIGLLTRDESEEVESKID